MRHHAGIAERTRETEEGARPNIAIAERNREAVVAILNSILADEYVIYTKTRNYHWNVTGPRFHSLHKFFEHQYEALNEVIDEVAERIRAIGGRPYGTLSEFLKHARVKEEVHAAPSDLQMIQTLLSDHESVIRMLRPDIDSAAKNGDAGTNNFLTDLLERHEKIAWMLRAFSENGHREG